LFCVLSAAVSLAPGVVSPLAGEIKEQELTELLAQNRDLQQQVQKQQKQIDELRQRLDALQGTGARPAPEPAVTRPEPGTPVRMESPVLRAARETRVSGEAGFAFFSSGREGVFPNSEFRVDDARIFLEAPVWQNVYFFAGLELTTREASDENFHMGEVYADFEDVVAAGPSQGLSVRVGRFNVPFGEEYQYRSVMTNPLITHSVADIWGIDSGLQLYGSLGGFQYNFAVQNGGLGVNHDFNKDKSLTARLSFDPVKSLHLSASAHRTGKLDAKNDFFSNLWFGGGFFGSLGPPATTRTFQASLFELDAAWRWKEGQLKATAGTARYDDDDTTADNSRRLHYYSLEAVQQVTEKLYGAARYSEVRVNRGYPLVGLGGFGEYYFRSPPTEKLHRLSLGLGYRFGAPLTWKLEYSWENGRLINGGHRSGEDMLSTEIGLKF
jgi:hypothetical protein